MTAKEIIKLLQLEKHPEGGYYSETYRSSEMMITNAGSQRHVSTAIYFLLENDNKSHFHRIKSDELWFFHIGETIEILWIVHDQIHTILLGNDILNGEQPQAMIPAGTWFAARLKNAKGYSLVSCTVAPGFDFQDFELAERENLTNQFPSLKKIIEEFTL